MRKINRTCIVCGHKYSYCPSCMEDAYKPKWMTIFHDENCKNIFNATSDYLANDITKEKAKELLDKCDLSNKTSLHHTIVEALDAIYKSDEVYEPAKNQKRKYEKKDSE